MAVSLNTREMAERLRDGWNWFVVARPTNTNGFAVLRIERNGWRPESSTDLPPSVRPEVHANVPAMQEAARHNQAVLDEGIGARFNWCFPVTPLIEG
ncbi:hypothetical protein Pan44_49510 [Caulifigura coniformis]|uniref:Uncharacterized protein n=2 Tax=Caulifigura coniformis TaxID=2527983 RepID=A0A517SL83_9PLAN|nr:hypothetical protein Pan44_49510 [Caulifigura coniformis]